MTPPGVYRLVALALCLWASTALAQSPATIIIERPEFENDSRQDFYWRVGAAALARTFSQYGPAQFELAETPLSRQGVMEALERGRPLHLAVLPTSREAERRLTPIRIPVDMGLLSYRVALIRADDQKRFDQVKTVDDLRSFRAGVGTGWVIGRVLEANALPMITSGVYRQLFSMLVGGRFDYFSRGVTEILPEYEQYSTEHPSLAIESKLMLHASLPVYFFASPTRPDVAQRMTAGMEALAADGTLRRMTLETFGDTMRRLNLKNRRVIELANPVVPNTAPTHRRELWIDPTAPNANGP